MPEKYEISLVVEGDNSTFLELGVLGKESSYHPSHSGSQHSVEVVENQLWSYVSTVVGSVIRDVFVKFHVGDAESGGGALWQMTQYQGVRLPPLFLENHYVRKVTFF